MMQLILIILTKNKETIYYYESFGYGSKCALNKHFYRSNGVSVPTENGSSILIMGFSLISHIMGFLNHPTSGLFTNKFLHININNKIISINRKEACTVPNSSTKVTNNKIRSSITK
jgi:hypothetical protein